MADGTCVACSGDSASLDASGVCECSDIDGMELTGSVCACSATNFEWDSSTSTCVCVTDTIVSYLECFCFYIDYHS